MAGNSGGYKYYFRVNQYIISYLNIRTAQNGDAEPIAHSHFYFRINALIWKMQI